MFVLRFLFTLSLIISLATSLAQVIPTPATADLTILEASVRYLADLELLVFEARVEGSAGATLPQARGALDGAPVLAYVFPTTLSPAAVGFGNVEGLLALAVTSHPDFDDTPLWDEGLNGHHNNHGMIFHTHWVVLNPDTRAPGGLSVREFGENETPTMPPTNPGLDIYLDSPGFTVLLQGDTLRVTVPVWRVGGNRQFNFDAVSVYMEVNTSDSSRPFLGVYSVYSVLSGDLSLPYSVLHP